MRSFKRNFGCLLLLLPLHTAVAVAKQSAAPAIQDSPAPTPAANPSATQLGSGQKASQLAQATAPVPDEQGFYNFGPGVVGPYTLNVPRVVLPKDTPPSDKPRRCVFSVAVGADGVPAKIEVIRALDDAACKAGTDASPTWKFTPGTVDGKAVPVRVQVSVSFLPGLYWTYLHTSRFGADPVPVVNKDYDTPPKIMYRVDAEFTDEARRAGLAGTVMLEMTINEKGVPKDVQVVRPLGMGLSEQALKAVRQYRFSPAMKDGKPVATKLTVEISFHLSDR